MAMVFLTHRGARRKSWKRAEMQGLPSGKKSSDQKVGDAVSLPSWSSDFAHGILIFRKDLLNNLSCVEFEVFVGASPDSGWYCQTLGVPPSQVCFNREELDPKRPQHSMETMEKRSQSHRLYHWSK